MILDFIGTPTFTYVLIGVLLLIIFVFLISRGGGQTIYYFSETERLLEHLSIIDMTPKALKTNDNKKFMRNAPAYTIRSRRGGGETIWLGKRGTAYTFKPKTTPKGKAVKVGSLWDGLTSIISDDLVASIKDEVKNKLIESEIFVTVELESGLTPDDMPSMTEEDVNTEANMGMANLIGLGIRSMIQKEDYIKYAGLVGLGIALAFVLDALGILTVGAG